MRVAHGLGLAAVLLSTVVAVEVTHRTALQVMDLYGLEHVAEPQVSSDGAAVVYVWQCANVMTESTYANLNLWSARLDGSMQRPSRHGRSP